MVRPGQIWKDTYGDGKPLLRGGEPQFNRRTVRVLRQEADGRWLVEMVTDQNGNPPRKAARQTRVSEKTFRGGYALQSDPA